MKGVLKILSHMDAHLIFVNDGSSDQTQQLLKDYFQNNSQVHLIQHEKNKGYSIALRTGIDRALELGVELVVTIDADTNYDHFYIPMLVDFFGPEYDIITVSPWHPEGQRKFFPRHRLLLSLGLSFLYRLALAKYKQPLYTYSACFRVAKAQVYKDIHWEGSNFNATSEILARCIANGFKVGEIPFAVNPRWFGMSKMVVFRQMRLHLKFLWHIWKNPDFLLLSKSSNQTSVSH